MSEPGIDWKEFSISLALLVGNALCVIYNVYLVFSSQIPVPLILLTACLNIAVVIILTPMVIHPKRKL